MCDCTRKVVYLAAQCWRRGYSLCLCPQQVGHISVACRQVPEFNQHFISPCWEPGLLGLQWSIWLQILDLPSQSTQGSLKYLHFWGRSHRNHPRRSSLLGRQGQMSIYCFVLLHLIFAVESCDGYSLACLPPWVYVVISVGFQEGG